MKKTLRIFVTLLSVLLLLSATAFSSSAAEFDFEAEIADFSETALNTETLTVGETHQPTAAVWLSNPNCKYYVSDSSVISVNGRGIVTAKAEGTSYVAFVALGGMSQIYCYHVEEAGFFSFLSGIGIWSFIVFCLILGVFVLLIASVIKSVKLDRAMRAVSSHPCEETARAALEEFSKINPIVRFNLSMGSDTRGVHFTYWRSVFNSVIAPSSAISGETKQALKESLERLNTWGLRSVKRS